MASDNYTAAVARHLGTKLHRASRNGTRCRCGACEHLVITTARRIGVSPSRLKLALPPVRLPKKPPRPHLTAQVRRSVTVSRGRRRGPDLEQLLWALGA
jgi:hypothetical protein